MYESSTYQPRENSVSMVSRKRKRQLSPYEKFKNRAMYRIKVNEKKIEDIAHSFVPQFEKTTIHSMTMVEKVALGKEIEQMMKMEKEKLSHETQVLKDRIDI